MEVATIHIHCVAVHVTIAILGDPQLMTTKMQTEQEEDFNLHKRQQIMYGLHRMEAKAGLKTLYLMVWTAVFLTCGCVNDFDSIQLDEANGSKLKVDSEKHLIIEVLVDTVKAEFLFDTGATSKLILSEAFAKAIGIDSSETQASLSGRGFSTFPPLAVRKVLDGISLDVLIGEDTVTYTEILVDNTIEPYNGIISIPHGDNRIWYLDFDKNCLVLKDTVSIEDTVRTFCLYYEESTGNYFVRNMDLCLASEDTSFIYENDYMLDTGFPGDLAIISEGAWGNDYDGLIDFLSEEAVSFTYLHHYKEAMSFNDMYIVPEIWVANDSIWIMCQKESSSGLTLSIMGLKFLYRYNISIDLSDMRLLMHRRAGQNASLSQASFESDSAAKMRTYTLTDGSYLIYEINHSSDMYMDGLREMDVILAIDGIACNRGNDGHAYYRDKVPGDSVVFTVLRNGHRTNIWTVR